VLYLSGKLVEGLPAMVTPRMRQEPPSGQPWAADNGRYASPHEYSDDGYLAWLAKMEPHRDRCLFATAPDVVGDAAATRLLSEPMVERIRQAGYRAAWVAQDGLVSDDCPWDTFDVLFLGGTTGWKLSEAAADLSREAVARGMWVHMGRVNSLRRLKIAASFGCGSVDGTFLRYGPDRRGPELQGWLDALAEAPMLWEAGR